MRFQLATIVAFAALSAALPTLQVRQSGPVLADTTYDAISISGGQAGNAEQEALNVFKALNINDPASVDKADIKFLNTVNQVANKAEKEAFNPAIEAATGAEKDALAVSSIPSTTHAFLTLHQAGKTKNKVLKLMATKLQLEAKQAQGEDVSEKLADELKKLNNNIATDKAQAGSPSTALPFTAAISGGGSVSAAKASKSSFVSIL
jgi:hypothetical protein